jgi:hypothetical protein
VVPEGGGVAADAEPTLCVCVCVRACVCLCVPGYSEQGAGVVPEGGGSLPTLNRILKGHRRGELSIITGRTGQVHAPRRSILRDKSVNSTAKIIRFTVGILIHCGPHRPGACPKGRVRALSCVCVRARVRVDIFVYLQPTARRAVITGRAGRVRV